jgi:hypothetical protein
MKFEIKNDFEKHLKELIKAFNDELITFDEMCELSLIGNDKIKINKLKR